MNWKPLLLSLACAFPAGQISAQSAVRTTKTAVLADVSLGSGNSGFEDSDGILTGNNGTSNATDWRSFIKFDLPLLGLNPITSAKLRVYHQYQSAQNTGNVSIKVLRITQAWIPPTSYQSSIYNLTTVDDGIARNIGGGVTGSPGSTMDTWVEFDVLPIVLAWQSGQPNHGISLRPGNENLDYSFKVLSSSREARQPELVLQYQTGGGPVSAPVADGPRVSVDAMRFTVIAPDCIRIENSRRLAFVDQATSVIRQRDLGAVAFTHTVDATHLTITTSQLTLKYKLGSNSLLDPNLRIDWTAAGRSATWVGGQPDTQNLGGTFYDLDRVGRSDVANFGIPVGIGTGLLSREGWHLLDDSDSMIWPDNAWMSHRGDDASTDHYFCAYGDDYKRMLKLFVDLSGKTPMVPNHTFGIWYSRYQNYTQSQFQGIVDRYRSEGIPFDVMGIDVDWHGHGWEGYDWNTSLISSPSGMINYFKSKGVKSCLNSHPGGFIQNADTHWNPGKTAAGIVTTAPYRFNFFLQPHAEASQSVNLKPTQQNSGVDFWWPDGGGMFTNFRTNFSLATGKAFYEVPRQIDSNKRILILNRYGGLGSQRYPIGFSGDTGATWQGLNYQPAFTARASNVSFPYWSHDIGGFDPYGYTVPDELYLRWAQFGVFSPVVRNHANHAPRLPWDYPNLLAQIKDLYKFRSRLFPYIYHHSRVVHDTGVGLVRPLYYHHPTSPEAYSHPQQYYFGGDLLVAPVTFAATAGTASQTMWLPSGKWTDYWTGEVRTGPASTVYPASLNQVPAYARPGAIIPHQPDMEFIGQNAVDPLTLEIFPHAAGQLDFYEDDGTTMGYATGQFARTPIRLLAPDTAGNYAVNIGAPLGSFTGQRTQRVYQLKLRRAGKPEEIKVDGVTLVDRGTAGAWTAAANGWYHDTVAKTTWVKLASRPVTQAASIEMRMTGLSNQVTPPAFSPPPETYATAQSIVLGTPTPDATIRFTTDGSDPTSTIGTLYTSPISIAASTTLKAIAYKSGLADSSVATGAYVIGVPGQAPYGGTAWALPSTTVQCEDYDVGGQGIAFNDTTTGNTGNSYRTSSGDNVDIETTTDSGGGFNLGWIAAGEWLEYSVDVALAGTYTLEARVASSGGGGSIRFEFDGVDKTGTMTVANTGGWQTYQNISKTGIVLPAGQQIVRLHVVNPGFNINWFRLVGTAVGPVATPIFTPPAGNYASPQNVAITTATGGSAIRYTTDGSSPTSTNGALYSAPVAVGASTTLRAIAYKGGVPDSAVASAAYTFNSTTQGPYGGTPAVIPGTIQAENYDTGGSGVAYQDNDATNNGGSFRTSEAVDLQSVTDTGGGHSIGWTVDGEWVEYTVTVATAGTYSLELRAGSGSVLPGALQVAFNGTDMTGPVNMVTTTWTTYTTITRTLTLGPGTQVMRVNIPNGGFNLNWLRFTLVAAAAPPLPANLRVMCVGDSITVGTGTTDGGYRPRLQSLLTGAGRTFDFIGTQSINSGAMGDPQHEGYGGYKSNQIDVAISSGLEMAKAQLYLIHIGTNDINMNETALYEGRMRALLDHAFAATPHARVILAKIIARQDGVHPDRYATIHAAVEEMVADYASAGRKITWVNQATLNGSTDYADATFHPNASGYQKMAQIWYSGIATAYTAFPETPYETWLEDQELTGADSLADADPDLDGLNNLGEFAFLTDPDQYGPPPRLAADLDGTVFRISYWRNKNAGDLDFVAEWSTGLTGWSHLGVTQVPGEMLGDLQRMHCEVARDGHAALFMRVRVGP